MSSCDYELLLHIAEKTNDPIAALDDLRKAVPGFSQYATVQIDRFYKNICNNKETRTNGVLCSVNDQPAKEYTDGTKIWCDFYGNPHRETGPAVLTSIGEKWYKHGKLHRVDGPAVISPLKKEWRIDGKKHRSEGQPAVEWVCGSKEWWVDGERYREEGPAIEFIDGVMYRNTAGEERHISETIHLNSIYNTVKNITNLLPAKRVDKIWYLHGKKHRSEGQPAVVCADRQEWWINGQRHRSNDLPAVEYADGDKEWWINGERHRSNDLPAVEYAGGKEWWINGGRHRENDLPAVIREDGHKEWWINGIRCRGNGLHTVETKEGDKKWVDSNYRLNRIDGPAVIKANGDKYWYKDSQKHREGGLPAVEYADGGKEWWEYGNAHREDGPASELADGSKKWCRHGIESSVDEKVEYAIEYW